MMMDGPEPKRLRLSKVQLEEMTKDEIISHWIKQEQYVDVLETKASDGQKDNSELVSLRESEEKMKQQQSEATRRENVLVMRLTTKEQEMQEYANQIQELKQAQVPGMAQLRSTLLDPAVNLMFERMKKELELMKAKLEETQNDLSAWKFTPDSNTGKRLMAKCRLLHQENEELGKMISSGRVAKLEGDLALQRNFSEEMKKSQAELDEFLMELDEDVEGMQSTIYYLQQQLRESKEMISKLQKEIGNMKMTKDPTVKPLETDVVSPAVDLSEGSNKNTLTDAGNVMDVSEESNELELRTSDTLTNEFQAHTEVSRPVTSKAVSSSPRTNGEPIDQPLLPLSRPSGCTMDINSSKAIHNNISSISLEDYKSERQRTLSPHIRYTPPLPGHDTSQPLNLHRNPSPNLLSMNETSITPPPLTDALPARSYTPPPTLPKKHATASGASKAPRDDKDRNGLSGKAAEDDHMEDSQNSDSRETLPSPHTPAEPPPIQLGGDDKDASETVAPTLKRNKSIEDNDHNYDHRTEAENKRTSIPNGVMEICAGKGDEET